MFNRSSTDFQELAIIEPKVETTKLRRSIKPKNKLSLDKRNNLINYEIKQANKDIQEEEQSETASFSSDSDFSLEIQHAYQEPSNITIEENLFDGEDSLSDTPAFECSLQDLLIEKYSCAKLPNHDKTHFMSTMIGDSSGDKRSSEFEKSFNLKDHKKILKSGVLKKLLKYKKGLKKKNTKEFQILFEAGKSLGQTCSIQEIQYQVMPQEGGLDPNLFYHKSTRDLKKDLPNSRI
jgi:hypothetical protein